MVKLKAIFRFCLFSSILIVLAGCPDEIAEHDLMIKINNKSSEKIVFFLPIDPIGKTVEVFDTTLTKELPWGNINRIDADDIVNPNSIGIQSCFSYHIQDVLNRGWLHFYIFNYDSLISIPWERIQNEYIVAKRVDFDTWEDLEAANFTITYP